MGHFDLQHRSFTYRNPVAYQNHLHTIIGHSHIEICRLSKDAFTYNHRSHLLTGKCSGMSKSFTYNHRSRLYQNSVNAKSQILGLAKEQYQGHDKSTNIRSQQEL